MPESLPPPSSLLLPCRVACLAYNQLLPGLHQPSSWILAAAMAGYQEVQDYRHSNEDFTEDEDEVDEGDLTEDESAEEDCAPYQVRHYHHYYYAPVTYNHHHHHYYYYSRDESDAYVTEDDSASSETDDGFEDEDEVKESQGSQTQTHNVSTWRAVNRSHKQQGKKDDTERKKRKECKDRKENKERKNKDNGRKKGADKKKKN